ncbi:GNAT family N-acetyltransferase [Bacillus sonorensis]|uniref:GNAT family N-acetyltransferase n=1 Tax=Bacillus sonorensis TaxID=119858 RepID=UPI00227F155B|nr:GNAT family N-acetyltransferase [Bacillus sonorensis]MCZ0067383.1 GNAT family N-acetyltransferase [Bacillus sonorensis]MCZ0095913.1 GNAT family N-acetyltransferase [Bacillus sonorensis]MEC1355367.1 GNAT family N-acetyltransferase [Bacillus sonorensis]MEC1426854.1 GNAT family N-acetyltransferase [Bacillus sonorensis]MEC1518780.1 GNAT family N-acetyltransferase [Bacillus sonorensis]
MPCCAPCAFISYCHDLRIKPRWDCDLYNKASIRLAEKLGFHPLKTIFIICRKSLSLCECFLLEGTG